MKELILATHNPGKIAELRAVLAPIHCISQHELGIENVEETGLSFIENAIIKARHASKISNKPALADDSGLVVKALDGQPGIYSARFSGEGATDKENVQKLLEQLSDIEDEKRQAYFYCAIALVKFANDPTPIVVTGQLNGYISQAPQGDKGFGYDPVFYLPDHQCTLAQLPAGTKNLISHRGMALRHLKSHDF
jgi:XTP/dITP diphosphohydrolase